MQKRHFETYNHDENIERSIHETLLDILKQYNCEELQMPIFTTINELIGNAVKANFKNIYFENYCPKNNAMDVIPYNVALKLFKLEMLAQKDNLHDIAKKQDIKVIAQLYIENNTLNVKISNPVLITEIEKSNILKKMKDSENISSLNEYFKTLSSDPHREGAGLGIIFIGFMLRSLGLSLESFKIYNDGKQTVSEIAIPLTSETLESYRTYIENQ